MGKTTAILALAVAAAWALDRLGLPLWGAVALKLFVFTPALLLSVFLCDLVTEDDLKRAAGIEIHTRWARRVRDSVVSASLRLSRAVEPLRPSHWVTAEES